MKDTHGWKHRRWITTICAVLMALGAGCSGRYDRSDGSKGSDDGSELGAVTPEKAREYIDNQHTVIMPWTHEVDQSFVEQADVGPDRIRLPVDGHQEAAGQYEVGDVLVSANPDAPFLRKITDIELINGEYVFHTRQAKLGEAIYKGELDTAASASGTQGQPLEDGLNETRRQFLSPDKIEGGGLDTAKEVTTVEGDVTFSMEPSVTVTPRYYLDVNLEPDRIFDFSETFFSSPHLRCPGGDVSYCSPVLSKDGFRGTKKYNTWCGEVDGMSNVCRYKAPMSADCDTIISALNYAESHPDCQEMFDRFYADVYGSEPYRHHLWNKRGCDHEDIGIHYPPHPIQVAWAKDHCHGAIKSFVADAEIEAKVSTGPIGIEAQASMQSEWFPIWERPEVELTRHVFFAGWLPVLITSNAEFGLYAKYDATITGRLAFDQIRIRGLKYGMGFHRYASAGYVQDKGVTMADGTFRQFYQGGAYGQWHLNPTRTPDPRITGARLQDKGVTSTLEGTMTAKIKAVPRLTLELYDLAGPYVEPASPTGEVLFAAGGENSSVSGVGTAGSTCNNSIANACARIGLTSEIGMQAEDICDGCSVGIDLYQDTCSDFCPANDEPLCAKWCFPEGDGKAMEIKLTWNSSEVDLDLVMIAPALVSHTERTGDWAHAGDTCPSDFSGCVDEADQNGEYLEQISRGAGHEFVDENTQFTIGVENFQQVTGALPPGVSYDLVVFRGGQPVKRVAQGKAVPTKGEAHSHTFTVPR